jgi:hypothetical protein
MRETPSSNDKIQMPKEYQSSKSKGQEERSGFI